MQEILLKTRYFEKGSNQNPLKNLTLFFLTQSLLMNKVIKIKNEWPVTLQFTKQVHNNFPLLVTYYLTKFDGVT